VLALAGLLFVTLPFLSDSEPREWILLAFGAVFLGAAIFGRDPVAPRTGRRTGSYWVLGHEPGRHPVLFAVTGGVLGGFYSLYYDSWRHAVFAAAAGLLLGALAPVLRYRIGAFLVMTLALTGFLVGIEWHEDYGLPATLFLAGMFAAVYAALLWGSTRDPLTED
jgi:hypothetical protein